MGSVVGRGQNGKVEVVQTSIAMVLEQLAVIVFKKKERDKLVTAVLYYQSKFPYSLLILFLNFESSILNSFSFVPMEVLLA
ncbi:hypothetical protein EYC80_000637 [Monilinia laxa]|uniref:Uncharacterized protein n=1 Tax=Monilinia laxa TaxID=61186 RepID=A0A5N6KB99_MONLA|nr:hypothetical protein EYC80_000637 [Monilinia laxa]